MNRYDITPYVSNIGRELPMEKSSQGIDIEKRISSVCYRDELFFYEVEQRWVHPSNGFISEWESSSYLEVSKLN